MRRGCCLTSGHFKNSCEDHFHEGIMRVHNFAGDTASKMAAVYLRGLRIVISHTYMYIIVYYDICSYHSTMRGNPRIPKMTPPKMWLSNRGVLLIPLQQLNIVSVFRRCTEARDEMRKGITGKPVKVLTAAVLQLFLEVRQALGEPGIGLPRQILAALWLQPAYRSWTPNLAPTQRSAWNVSSGSEPFQMPDMMI